MSRFDRPSEVIATGSQSPIPPPRLLPDRPFPPYAYQPGRNPHPTRDPDGHSYGTVSHTPEPPDPEHWVDCGDYLYGIDLFNHGYYWEAHEAWEGLWVACGREGLTAIYLQALINLTAAGFKARWGSARGMSANAATAVRLLQSLETESGQHHERYMGLNVRELIGYAGALSAPRQAASPNASDQNPLEFDLVLWTFDRYLTL